MKSGGEPFMPRLHFRNPAVSAFALVMLVGCAALGCGDGDDEPTGPEPVSLSDLFGSQLFKADGSTVGVESLNDIPVIGIYFASSTCPACTAFTPVLIDAYEQMRDEGRSFEVVLVTQNMTDSSLFDYMTDSAMPWLAVSSQSSQASTLAQRYYIQWVPTLVIIDGEGDTVSLYGREEVTDSGAAAYDSWLAASGGG
jgi:nucleoredoxin